MVRSILGAGHFIFVKSINPIYIHACAHVPQVICVLEFVPRCDFLLVRSGSFVASDWLICGRVQPVT